MAGGFATIPMVLQLIGQAPNQHGRKTAIENLRAVKSLFPMFGVNGKLPPQMQQIVDNMMQNGPQALVQNPIGALGGALQGQIGGIAGQIGNIPGAGGLVAALTGNGGLQAAVSSLVGSAGGLVGLPGNGAFGIEAVIGHAGLASLGELPAAMGLDRVIAPVMQGGGLLGGAQSTLNSIQSAINNGGDPTGYVGQVLNHVASMNDVVNGSVDALSRGLVATSGMSAFSIVADGLDPTRGAHPLLDFFHAIVLPDAIDAIGVHHTQMIAEAPIRSGRNRDGTVPGYTPPEGLEEP